MYVFMEIIEVLEILGVLKILELMETLEILEIMEILVFLICFEARGPRRRLEGQSHNPLFFKIWYLKSSNCVLSSEMFEGPGGFKKVREADRIFLRIVIQNTHDGAELCPKSKKVRTKTAMAT